MIATPKTTSVFLPLPSLSYEAGRTGEPIGVAGHQQALGGFLGQLDRLDDLAGRPCTDSPSHNTTCPSRAYRERPLSGMLLSVLSSLFLGVLVVKSLVVSTDWPLDEGVVCEVPTPTLVYSERSLEETNDLVREMRRAMGCRVLYAMKAMPFAGMLQAIEAAIDGFAASSLFEAQLARALFPWKQLHFTTPGLRPHEVESLSGLCDSKLYVGTRVVFVGSGAYTLAKAHQFNGVNLPTIWALATDGTLRLCKQYTSQHYKDQWMPDE